MKQQRVPTQTVSKKVNAYPISAQLKSSSASIGLRILKVTEQGFLAEVPTLSAFLLPGEKFDCSFELPVLHHILSEQVLIIKIYSKLYSQLSEPSAAPASGPSAGQLTGMVEAHFTGLSKAGREHILSFLKALAKTKK